MKRRRLLASGIGLLDQVLLDAHTCQINKPENLKEAFIYRHARNISQLGRSVLLLEENGQNDPCPIIARAMFESLFKLLAAKNVQEASVGIVLSEVTNEIARIQKWIEVVGGDSADLIDTLGELTAFANGLRAKYSVSLVKGWSVFECAKAAKLDQMYRQSYFLLSKHAHATASGIIAQENEIVTNHVLSSVFFVVLCAVGNLVQAVETETPQQYVDSATKLLADGHLVLEADNRD